MVSDLLFSLREVEIKFGKKVIFQELNLDPDDTIKKANEQEINDKYLSNTEYAYKKGVFGSPTFIYDGKEVFWGDDRLEDCIKWIKLQDN